MNRKLGLTPDDLNSEIREQVWKGLLTWTAGKANLKTYLNNLIANRFKTLYDKSISVKNSSMDYYAEVYSDSPITAVERKQLEDHDTGEASFLRRQEIMKDRDALGEIEKRVYIDLLFGYSIADMCQKYGKTRLEITQMIRDIDQRVGERRGNTSKGAL